MVQNGRRAAWIAVVSAHLLNFERIKRKLGNHADAILITALSLSAVKRKQ